MLVLITGGSGSGKSEYAENTAIKLKNKLNAKKLIYIATMKPYGEEAFVRIERHRAMRKNKGFETIECYSNINSIDIDSDSVVLLECMSNLAANEIFEYKNTNAINDILKGVNKLYNSSKAIVVVTNEIFSDTLSYSKETIDYIKAMGHINRSIAKDAQLVVEVVCSIPVLIKGSEAYVY